MADALRKLGAFFGALALVIGLIAVLGFLAKLGGGEVTALGAIGFVLGAAALVRRRESGNSRMFKIAISVIAAHVRKRQIGGGMDPYGRCETLGSREGHGISRERT